MTEPTYIAIFCERKRAEDMDDVESWDGNRCSKARRSGKAFAKRVDGIWCCTCCGTRVAVVW